MAAVVEADYQNTSQGNFARASIFLPPLFELETPEENDPFSWYLRDGIDKFAIKPKPVDISIGRLTHLSYPLDKKATDQRLIRLKVSKDFRHPDVILTSTSFGRLVHENGDIRFDYDQPEDGLVVHWHPNLPENSITSWLTNEMRQIQVKAVIQHLNLALSRPEPVTITNVNNPPIMTPKYISRTILDSQYPQIAKKLEGSQIYFESERRFQKDHQVGVFSGTTFYRMLGFNCTETDSEVFCQLIMTTADTKGSSVFEKVRNFASKHLTRFIVGFIIPNIETALDEHIGEIIEELFDELSENQNKVLDPIRQGLFSNDP